MQSFFFQEEVFLFNENLQIETVLRLFFWDLS